MILFGNTDKMYTHFTDSSNEKGQYNLLLQNQIQGGLLSYHYLDTPHR